jgi:hypothetical protein
MAARLCQSSLVCRKKREKSQLAVVLVICTQAITTKRGLVEATVFTFRFFHVAGLILEGYVKEKGPRDESLCILYSRSKKWLVFDNIISPLRTLWVFDSTGKFFFFFQQFTQFEYWTYCESRCNRAFSSDLPQ